MRPTRASTLCLACAAVLWVMPGTVRAQGAPAASMRPVFSLDEIIATPMLGQFRLSPNRRLVAFTGVGRYFGHPLFPDFGEAGNLQVVDLVSGARQQVTSGTTAKTYPRFSPDSTQLAYEAEGDIWVVALATGIRRRLTTHASPDRGVVWSPDGKELAFVSSRWGRTDIYVMGVEGERAALRRVTNDEFGEAALAWSPDGRTLIHTSTRDEHFYSRALYAVPAAGGTGTRLTPPDNARNNLPVFSPSGERVVYLSDRSGFLNLWSMRPDGSDHRQVTTLAQDQDYPENDYIQPNVPVFSPDGRRVLHYAIRDGNLDLVVADLAAGTHRVIDSTDGSHHPVGWLDDRTVAYAYENFHTPPDLFTRGLDAGAVPRQVTSSSRPIYRPAHFDRVERATWSSAGGIQVSGFVRRPSNVAPGLRLPALVMSHTYNVGQFYNQWNPILSFIVQSGYLMLTVDHRGSGGYGVAFRDLPKGNWGFAQLDDLVSAAGVLRARPDVDASRVGVMGYSMGGYLTLMAMTNAPEVFRAGASIFGLGEITGDPQRSSPNYVWHLGGREAEQSEAYRRASPVTRTSAVKGAILIVHSDGDPIEPVTKVHNFTQALERDGKTFEVVIYPNEAHGLRRLEHQRDSVERLMTFLDRYLKR